MRTIFRSVVVLISTTFTACAAPGTTDLAPGAVPVTVVIPAGSFISGSDGAEREAAYRLDEAAYGHKVTRERGWYDGEDPRRKKYLRAFAITGTAITNRHYLAFVRATGHAPPDVDAATWRSYGLIHPFARTRRHAWAGSRPPAGRLDHPVVLVSFDDARAYADWLGDKTGDRWRLPTAPEWEKAVRGTKGAIFPWGKNYDPAKLNSADKGPFDTMPVGRFPEGGGPFGLLDGAGQVFEWTASPHPTSPRPKGQVKRFQVKGGSWDDKGCGICRPAARHSRPREIKHILIGFRLVRDVVEEDRVKK